MTGPIQATAAVPVGGESVYEPLLTVPGAVALALALLLIVNYVVRLLPRRREEIRECITDEAMDRYHQLFRPRFKGTGEQSIQDAFGATHSSLRYLLPTALLLAVLLGASTFATLVADAVHRHEQAIAPVFESAGPASAAALAGAVIWCLYELIARVVSRSLDPDVLHSFTLRLVAAVPIGLSMAAIVTPSLGTFIAFGSAAFPLRETRLLLRRLFLKHVDAPVAGVAPEKAVQGRITEILDAMPEESAFQLDEVQIVTYLDLAYADPIRLMARTGRRLRLILAWIDQALLAVYAPAIKPALAKSGIPCALDAAEFYDQHFAVDADGAARSWQTDVAVLALAEKTGMPPALLREVFQRVHEDPHVVFLRCVWYTAKTAGSGPAAVVAGA